MVARRLIVAHVVDISIAHSIAIDLHIVLPVTLRQRDNTCPRNFPCFLSEVFQELVFVVRWIQVSRKLNAHSIELHCDTPACILRRKDVLHAPRTSAARSSAPNDSDENSDNRAAVMVR